jgi:hypothetical protein
MYENFREIQLLMAMGVFIGGAITFWLGIFILFFRSTGRDVKTIANQTSQLAQKGFAEEIAGLVGNASALINAMNELSRTTAGIGIYLSLIGLSMMGAAIWIVAQLQ